MAAKADTQPQRARIDTVLEQPDARAHQAHSGNKDVVHYAVHGKYRKQKSAGT